MRARAGRFRSLLSEIKGHRPNFGSGSIFEIIGEALNRIRRIDPATAARVPEHDDIIAFRNLLIHGYDVIDHARVWQVIENDLPRLHEQVQKLLNEIDSAP